MLHREAPSYVPISVPWYAQAFPVPAFVNQSLGKVPSTNGSMDSDSLPYRPLTMQFTDRQGFHSFTCGAQLKDAQSYSTHDAEKIYKPCSDFAYSLQNFLVHYVLFKIRSEIIGQKNVTSCVCVRLQMENALDEASGR